MTETRIMNHQIINTPHAPKAVGTYSQGVISGNFYFFSGQIGLDPITMELKESFEQQLEQILHNIDYLLESVSLARENIIKTTIFLTSLDDFQKVNEHYERYFTAPYPARSCVEISKLPKNALIEIEVFASK